MAKLSAFLLMLADHLNSYLLAGAYEWVWHAGRLVFPVFALVLGLGVSRNEKSLMGLAGRLFVVAVLAEFAASPLLAAGVRPDYWNVCFTLLAGVLLVEADRAWSVGWKVAFAAAAVLLSWGSEYGFLGAALVWAAARRSTVWVYVLLAVLALWQGSPVPLLAVGCLAWCDAEASGLTLRGWRMAFGIGYVVQFAVFSALWWAAQPQA